MRLIKRYLYILKRRFLFLYGLLFLKKLNILNNTETINYIIQNNVSISRLGNGELDLIIGDREYFQSFDVLLKRELLSLSTTNKMLLCVPKCLEDNKVIKGYKNSFWKKHRRLYLFYWRYYYNKNTILGDSCFTRFYIDYKNHDNLGDYITLLKTIWEKRNILMVEGSMTKLGMANDLFDNTSTIRRIVCPPSNAFEKIDLIEKTILEYYKDGDLVIMALGPTASILASRLSKKNIQAIDIGHIDIEYEWYIRKVDNKIAIPGKYVNEVDKGNIPPNLYSTKRYLDQIIAKVE